MNKITEGLFQGSLEDVSLASKGLNPDIDYIFYFGQDLPNEISYNSQIPIIHIPLNDGKDNPKKIQIALALLHKARYCLSTGRNNILVGCRAGLSRSPFICMLFLSKVENLTIGESEKIIEKACKGYFHNNELYELIKEATQNGE